MNQAKATRHACHRCCAHDMKDVFPVGGASDELVLDSIEATFSEGGDAVFFASGYSAREIAQKRARETGGQVYVNSVSRNVKRRDLSVPVAYGVAKGPVYTVRPPDDWHETVYRAYWPPL